MQNEILDRNFKIDNYTINLGADVLFTEILNEEASVEYWVLGEFFTVDSEKESMCEILNSAPKDRNAFLDLTDSFAGVFLIFRKTEELGLEIFTDCASIYKCYYELGANSEVIAIASDPALLAKYNGALKDDSAQAREYYNSEAFQKFPHRIGNLTSYRNVFQLISNHSLNLDKNEVSRVFPREPIKQLSKEQSAKNVKSYFKTLTSKLIKKYNVKVAITAGWDSRMVLTGTLDYKDSIEYYTFRHENLSPKHKDIVTSEAIARTLGLNYTKILAQGGVDPAYLVLFKENFGLIPEKRINIILNALGTYNNAEDRLLIGTVSEVAKNYYEDVEIASGEDLLKAAHYPKNEYTLRYFNRKYEELKQVESKFGYDLRDIGHWEQDITNFAAHSAFVTRSFAHVFPPFNCRKILKDILSVDRSLRDKQSHKFYNYFVSEYAPEISQIKVNYRLKIEIIRWMKKAKIYSLYKKIEKTF